MAASDSLFCPSCGNLLDLPSATDDYIVCQLCNHSQHCSVFEDIKVITKSRPNAFRKQIIYDEDTQLGAIIDEKCPKCNHNQMKFFTLQLRSADEGQTVFYTCIKCRMFTLVTVNDRCEISPKYFHKSFHNAIVDEIDAKYANRILHQVGLCLTCFDLEHTGDPFITAGDGGISVDCRFRLAVFRPFIGETLVGRIRASDKSGIFVSVGFFSDIFIPSSYLPENTIFKSDEQLWVWLYEGETEMYLDIEDEIRFRVVGEQFIETPAVSSAEYSDSMTANQFPVASAGSGTATASDGKADLATPYSIIAAINDSGLGCLSWWM